MVFLLTQHESVNVRVCKHTTILCFCKNKIQINNVTNPFDLTRSCFVDADCCRSNKFNRIFDTLTRHLQYGINQFCYFMADEKTHSSD